MRKTIVILSSLLVFCCLPIYSVVNDNQVQKISSLHELDTLVKKTNKKVIFIDFYKDSCPPCELFKLLYESWAHLFGKEIVFIKVDTGSLETAALCQEYKISRLPTLIVLDSQGREIKKRVGMEEIKKFNVGNFLAEVRESSQIRVSNK